MNSKTFIEELKEDCKSKKTEELLSRLIKNLDYIGEEWANEIVEDIKKEILSKAHAGEYEIVRDKKIIRYDFKWSRYNYKRQEKYGNQKVIKQDVELEKLLLELHKRKIYINDYCQPGHDSDDYYWYEYLKWSLAGKLKKSLSFGQIILGFFTFGIFFLLCLSNEPNYYAYRQKRLYKGTQKLDYVSSRCLNLVKLKLKEEKIVFESFNIKIKDSWYNLGDDINAEIPVRFMDDKDGFYYEPLFLIKCKVVFE